jgi:membrane protein implicated in regulation of membrane protease activity
MSQWQNWYWFVIGGVLMFLELAVFGAVLLWFGIAAILTGVVSYFLMSDMGGLAQIWLFLAFAIASLGGIAATRKYIYGKPPQQQVNARLQQMVGQRGILDTPILAGRGSMRLGDTVWAVRGPELPAGTVVDIVSFDGETHAVRKAD